MNEVVVKLQAIDIASIKDLILKNPLHHILEVEFLKKDGTLRKMKVLTSKALEASVKNTDPEKTAKTNATLKNNNMIKVEEVTNDGRFQWRVINLATVKRIKKDKVEYII